jgi:dolichol-phosphate mannosyltransferase
MVGVDKIPSIREKLSIIIPVFNEEGTLKRIVEKIQCVPLEGIEKEIVLVDDGSIDQTRKIIKSLSGVKYVFHESNQGKGAAIKTGINHSSGNLILIQDADLEYFPEDYPILLAPLLNKEVEFVMGTRFVHSNPKFFTKEGDPFFSHYIGNKLIIWLTNVLYGQRHTDYESCYKLFTRSLANQVQVSTNGFAFDNELICKCLRKKYQIKEVPVRYNPRPYSSGKKINWKDGITMLWAIVKWRIMPL